MSDETSDLQTQVSALQSQMDALEAKVSAIQAQIGNQAPPDDDDGDIPFPVGGAGP
jgi:chaperonin cofactor prefoldin